MLDQYAVTVPAEDIINDTTIKTDKILDICYWSNEGDLDLFMCDLYDSAHREGDLNGNDGEFVRVRPSDLNVIRRKIKDRSLKVQDPENMSAALSAIESTLSEGRPVFYMASF